MVSFHTLVAFALVSLPLILLPGPAVAFILSRSLTAGRGVGLAATAGVETGYLLHVFGAAVGISAAVAASARAFTLVKTVGALWLLYLAWSHARPRRRAEAMATGAGGDGGTTDPLPSPESRRKAYRRGLLVGASNPKTAIFYLAFLPQFVQPDAGPVSLQLLTLGLLFIALATVSDACWALFGSLLRRALPALRMRLLDRLAAVVYAALAVVTLTVRRAAPR